MTRQRISETEIRACYEAARHSEGKNRNLRAKEVATTTGMSQSSANHYIKAVEQMMENGHYNMTVNADATALYLNWIGQDYGPAAICVAAEVVLRHVDYYAAIPSGSEQPAIRRLAEMVLEENRIPTKNLPDLATVRLGFDKSVQKAMALSEKELAIEARKSPNAAAPKIEMVTTVRQRNPHVKALVLLRADGKCENSDCLSPAPFVRDDGSVFLEVHHKTPLAEDGPDTIENAIALCPNCHREAHYGENWEKFRK